MRVCGRGVIMVGSEYPLDWEYSFVFSLLLNFLLSNIIIDLGPGAVDNCCAHSDSLSQ